MNSIEEIWKDGTMGRDLNERLIILLPKKDSHLSIGNWRPITLLNTFYKLVSKTLSMRIEDHMDGWAGKAQRGFIKGRCILDNLILDAGGQVVAE